MTTIQLTTKINAPIEITFDLSRNIDVHQQSTSKSNETAIDGVISGLINLNETVTWRGKHFGVYLKHKSLISAMEIPTYFVDEMLEGKFKSFKHQHTFIQKKGFVIMEDKIQYETPYGIFGKIFDHFLLKKHLTKFISERNSFIKSLAENHQK
ncbi:SRPBCC family protein [Flavobacterium turcicum]|uniref:SRPBCC family protein n=1 Tax=Flavobacterium turcicum TaxID=2764718 RepID=A0ABR7JIH7_9FLAO|nr:SRPBCC family protein [Flavobacterium turcicum]MBC5864130.1 SRPBCC family protein [Flavobacterium turcicum]NHL03036.1 SRPBCC family protein [Flavobacterium turcicum]